MTEPGLHLPVVGILMGSASDAPVMQETANVLEGYGIPYEMRVLSAHRMPDAVRDYARAAGERGLKLLIAGAGGGAHLAGVLASWTTLPVIGVPLASSPLGGQDALHAMVQMPAGVPVACMAVGEAGARNAGHFAALILALGDPAIAEGCARHRQRLAEG